jgi:nitrate/nitrite transporter NarK
MASISLSVLGGLFYAIAPAFGDESTALASVALGRILGGFGRANSALGFAYVARGCPVNKRTSVTTLLGGAQMIGMAIAPLFSACFNSVNFSLFGIHFDNLNSVGMFIVIINVASQVVIYLFLPDLPTVVNERSDDNERELVSESNRWLQMFRCTIRNPHIGVPFLTIFTFNFNWQFIETALAPVSFDLFGWVSRIFDEVETFT